MENEEAAKALCPDCGCGGCLEELIVKENSKDVVNQTINEESDDFVPYSRKKGPRK